MDGTILSLQLSLSRSGYGPGEPDGIFGPATAAAVRAFQRDRGLRPDGIPGPRTFAAIESFAGGDGGGRSSLDAAGGLSPPSASASARRGAPRPLREALRASLVALGGALPRTDEVALVGVRGWQDGGPVPNRFDSYNDTLFLLLGSPLEAFPHPASVDPGRLPEFRPGGVAHLLPGLYDYRLGRHRGREAALVQAGPVRIERFHDDDPGRMEPVREEGWFGINIHRGGAGSRVGAWSAGCQVVQGAAWPDFIGAVQRAGEAGQERFLYLLMEGTDLARTLRVLAAGAAGQGSPPRSSEYGRSRTG